MGHVARKGSAINLFSSQKYFFQTKNTDLNRSMSHESWPIRFDRFKPELYQFILGTGGKWTHSYNLLVLENFQNLHFVVFLAAVTDCDVLMIVADLATDWAMLMLHCKFPFGFDWRQLKVMWFNFWSHDFFSTFFIWTCSINEKSRWKKKLPEEWLVQDIIKTDNVSGHETNIQKFSMERTSSTSNVWLRTDRILN